MIFDTLRNKVKSGSAALAGAAVALSMMAAHSVSAATLLQVDLSNFETDGTVTFIGVPGALPSINLGPFGSWP